MKGKPHVAVGVFVLVVFLLTNTANAQFDITFYDLQGNPYPDGLRLWYLPPMIYIGSQTGDDGSPVIGFAFDYGILVMGTNQFELLLFTSPEFTFFSFQIWDGVIDLIREGSWDLTIP